MAVPAGTTAVQANWVKNPNRWNDVRRVAKILREGGYTYDQSKHLFAASASRLLSERKGAWSGLLVRSSTLY